MKQLIVVILLAQLFIPSEALHASPDNNSCFEQFLKEIPKPSQPTIESTENIFTKTFVPSIISASVWFLGVRVIHSCLKNDIEEMMSSAVLITLAIDLFITSLSHYISQSDSKTLKNFLNGKYVPTQSEFISRSFANVIVGTTVITSSWMLTGTSFHTAFINALGVCTPVYFTLQWMKDYLFRKLPKEQDKLFFKQFLKKKSLTNQNSLNLSELQDYLLEYPVEDWFKHIASTTKMQKLIEKTTSQKDPIKKKKNRSKLLQVIYKSLDSKRILDVIQQNQSAHFESIHQLFELITKRNVKRSRSLFLSSFIDMGVSVGFAGGVLLYHVTKMSQQGISFLSFFGAG